MYATASDVTGSTARAQLQLLGDFGAAGYKVNSPAGEYGLLYTSSATPNAKSGFWSHIFSSWNRSCYSIFLLGAFGDPTVADGRTPTGAEKAGTQRPVNNELTGSTIDSLANGLRFTMDNIDFNNTTELNLTIYFVEQIRKDYNYSSNPTYLTASKIRVKNDNPKAEPISLTLRL